ncbi:hypothetical protein J31TS4_21820 [Paenibacillus sp. J31TS4]|uniref:hypothetical protein n=1 Tax=Paenibacillus sp. J31TS4 TaxID=2807195 RepID=UPI001B0C89EA|nr:hypothetical protein [Paenibacillus sp. J31TS4]GIP38902.1 hypothetical protein J31TS4_21820 [Paenibacillus sp. J31TS4]
MKAYAVFIGSFLAAYLLLQIGSGMVLTLLYVPDLSSTAEASAGTVRIGAESGRSALAWLLPLIAAVTAFAVSNRLIVRSGRRS